MYTGMRNGRGHLLSNVSLKSDAIGSYLCTYQLIQPTETSRTTRQPCPSLGCRTRRSTELIYLLLLCIYLLESIVESRRLTACLLYLGHSPPLGCIPLSSLGSRNRFYQSASSPALEWCAIFYLSWLVGYHKFWYYSRWGCIFAFYTNHYEEIFSNNICLVLLLTI